MKNSLVVKDNALINASYNLELAEQKRQQEREMKKAEQKASPNLNKGGITKLTIKKIVYSFSQSFI